MEDTLEPDVRADSLIPTTKSGECGWCGKATWFQLLAAHWAGWESLVSGGRLQRHPRLVAVYQCGGCENASLLVWWASSFSGRWSVFSKAQWPARQASPMSDLHDAVQGDRLQAWNSYFAGQHRAAVLMARTALQRAVRFLLSDEKGQLDSGDRGSLNSELDLTLERGLITSQLRANADEVRLSGNDVAHPEEMGEITEGETRESLVFLDDFCTTALAVPARQRKRQAARQEAEGT